MKQYTLNKLIPTFRGLSAESMDPADKPRDVGIRQILTAILLCWNIVAMAAITIQVNPPTVQLGDTFRLTMTNDDPQSGGIPNLMPLQKDFNIIGTERSMQYSIVNGQTHGESKWTVLLSPKKKGTLTIPPIQIGGQFSPAGSVSVTSVQAPANTDDPDQVAPSQEDVILKTEISSNEPYVNQQVTYTVKLYNSQRLLDAQYAPPQVEDALFVPLGDGRRYQTTLNGRNYEVEEQQYAIFPQKSGELKIISPKFHALVFDTVPRRIKVSDKSTKLTVKPIPASYKWDYWLPATQVALTEVYDQSNTTMKQGNTLVRTVTLQAAGVPAQLLPILKVSSGPQFNVYAEKPDLHNSARQKELIGRADVKMTYVLNKAGHITIPELRVHWFNTTTGKEEVASLPARHLDIQAANGTVPQTEPVAPTKSDKTSILSPKENAVAIPAKTFKGLAWWLAGGFALAWIVTLALWWSRKGTPVSRDTKRQALKQLRVACTKNNPSQVRDALLHWATLQWPEAEVLNLHHIAKLVHDASLKKELSLLSQVLYSRDRTLRWQGDALWRSLSAYLRIKPKVKKNKKGLPPINPN